MKMMVAPLFLVLVMGEKESCTLTGSCGEALEQVGGNLLQKQKRRQVDSQSFVTDGNSYESQSNQAESKANAAEDGGSYESQSGQMESKANATEDGQGRC